MSEGLDIVPLTAAEKQQLADLQHRQTMEQWQAAEDQRQSDLAAIWPALLALGGSEQVNRTIADLEASTEGLADEDRARVARLVQILRYDGRALAAKHRQLSQPLPEPGVDITEPEATA